MKRNFTKIVGGVLLALLMVPTAANADWTDIKVELTSGTHLTLNANLLTSDEITNKTSVEIGIDATMARVDKDAAEAIAVLSGKYHSDEHGWGNFSATVPVEAGTYRIYMGTCNWGGDVKIKNGGTEIATFSTCTGVCYHNNKTDNIASTVVVIDAATTLTISGGSYTPYFAVEKTTYVPNNVTLSFSKGDTGAEGDVPPSITQDIKAAPEFTMPGNFMLYKEGYTFECWQDAGGALWAGTAYGFDEDAVVTPRFEANTVSLNDRSQATTVVWDFQRKNGAPTVSYEGKTGVWVAQADVLGYNIDVPMYFDTNNGGKLANGSWNDWAQLNGGTKLTIPAAKGMKVTIVTYNAMTTTTIAGSSEYDAPSSGSAGNFSTTATYNGSDATIDIVIGDGSYYRTITVVYPGPEYQNIYNGELLYGTYYNSTMAVTLPDGLQAATVDEENGGVLTLNWRYNAGDVVPAGTAVLLKATSDMVYTLTEKIGDATAAPAGNLLKGTDEAALTTGGTKYYALQNGANGLGFYWMAADGAAFTNGANKAYLALPAASPAPFLSLFGDATAISSVGVNSIDTDRTVFNMQGQRIQQPKRGLYIVGGKKIVVK